MTATRERIPLDEARKIAGELVTMLSWFCDRIEVAGSIRRGKPDVHDIEILVIPTIEVVERDLFGDPTKTRNLFNDHCDRQKADGVFSDRLGKDGKRAWGQKYKRALYGDIPVDLFSAAPENWGVQYVLRTGPAEFNRKLVTLKAFGGLTPFGMSFADGYLWRGNERIDTPEEQDVFDALGLEWIEPANRR